MVFNGFSNLADKVNMARYFEKKCPKCKQRLRIPKNVGGVTMVCPTCGTKMASDFKIGRVGAAGSGGVVQAIVSLFEQPGRIFDRLMKIVFPG